MVIGRPNPSSAARATSIGRWVSARLLAASATLMLLGVAYFLLFGTPMAFLRGATLRLEASPEAYALELPVKPSDGPLERVRSIPSPPMDRAWWSPAAIVSPNALESYVFEYGAGNCAAKSRALGWWLSMRDIPFRFVYLMKDPQVREGDAHTMVETTWSDGGPAITAILDPLAAGVPMVDGRPLTSERLIAGRGGLNVRYEPARPDLDAYSLRPAELFVAGDARERSFVAYSAGREVVRHLKFMEALGVVVPDSFPTRVAGMIASIGVGLFPKTYVPSEESGRISWDLRQDAWIAQATVWMGRASALLACVVAVQAVARVVRKRRLDARAP